MNLVVVFAGIFMLICFTIFYFAFKKDRSRYRNCYLLFIALFSAEMFIITCSGDNMLYVLLGITYATLIFLLIVPFFFIFNGISMIKKEGFGLSHMLSLGLGIIILIGEIVTVWGMIAYSVASIEEYENYYSSVFHVLGAIFSMTVIYGSMAFLIFMIYVLFLHIVPRKKDFDYIIIHGSGLLDGDRVPRLLADRIDKAIDIYKKAPNTPKLIPSGGQGSDEAIPEAEAMKKYLLEKGIPEEDIIVEDKSETTYENLSYSKKIIDAREGRKYIALVTSNYHVYRALRYCRKIGLKCTGIGSRVAFYYWPSALIREFIAIHAEKKHAVIFFGGWIFCLVSMLINIYG